MSLMKNLLCSTEGLGSEAPLEFHPYISTIHSRISAVLMTSA